MLRGIRIVVVIAAVGGLAPALAAAQESGDEADESDAQVGDAHEGDTHEGDTNESVSATHVEHDLVRARESFRLATQLYQSGRFMEAAEEFERAYALSGEGQLLHNIYIAWRDQGDTRRAAQALRRYLAAGAPGSDEQSRSLLEHRLDALETAIREDDREHAEDAPEGAGHELAPPSDASQDAAPGADLDTALRPTDAPAQDTGSGEIAEQWWFWTIIVGVVAAAAATTIAIVATSQPNAISGDVLGRVETLRWSL